MDFKNGVINIQAAGYNGALSVTFFFTFLLFFKTKNYAQKQILAKFWGWVSVCNEVL
jgi:hypothetical protein